MNKDTLKFTKREIILKFIKLFQNDDTIEIFTTGCCYYFALILNTRFKGKIVYNDIDNHFAFKYEDRLYDITGEITNDLCKLSYVNWEDYITIEPRNSERVIKDCILKV